jgi:UDP-N-acetyl-2-amino-2-deoxyglucuronate dehydrogenase
VRKFALIGVGGYIATRHLQAMKSASGDLIAAVDKNGSVGVLDNYFMGTLFCRG